ncbi:MAG: hypothetical protein JXB85_11435 [Anaerolineales bacterium]|nr:hypothetical protein [Anaerolineales bacterium]
MFKPHFLRCWFYFCVLLLVVSALGGCDLPSDEPCTAAELESVIDPAPFYEVVDTLTPVLTWSYPDPSCHPDHYHITIFDQDVARWPNDFSRYPPAPIFEVDTETDDTSFYVPASAGLLPGETYFVEVEPKTADNGGHDFTIWWFSTGPSCPTGTRLLPPTLLYPPDGATMYFPDTVDLAWDNQMTCWPANDFYLQISTTEDFAAPIWYGTTYHNEFIWISDGPPMFSDCTRYYWRVQMTSDSAGGPFSETWSFILSWSEVFCPLELAVTLIPREPVVIPPVAEVKTSAACRSGPGLDYEIRDYLVAGQILPVEGRNADSTWWVVFNPALQAQCWISGRLVDLSGDYSQAPVVPAPPLPLPAVTDTPAPFDCGQYATNPAACDSSNSCRWDASIPPNGACVNR